MTKVKTTIDDRCIVSLFHYSVHLCPDVFPSSFSFSFFSISSLMSDLNKYHIYEHIKISPKSNIFSKDRPKGTRTQVVQVWITFLVFLAPTLLDKGGHLNA